MIIYPHWHPANLAGVHRPRLVGNNLGAFGWKPRVVTVDEAYYEEDPDYDFIKTFSGDFQVNRVKAIKISKPRIIGDIGLRSFYYLYRAAIKIVRSEKIDFVWIPIPSFYVALLGRMIHEKTQVSYGIDYIDPWVRDISMRKDWRHKLSNSLAKMLEPIAVKRASLITGVSYEYYKPVLERNFKRRTVMQVGEQSDKQFNLPDRQAGSSTVQQFNRSTNEQTYKSTDSPIYHTAFPYGFDSSDHQVKLENIQYPWKKEERVKPWIYAGAFLPNSRLFVQLIFKVIAEMRKSGMWDEDIRLYFIGTGAYSGKLIMEYAEDVEISDIVHEDRSRYPYLHILNFLSSAETVMVIGSTERHYTASKVYQALLSERPVWAIFHHESSAVKVMEECGADQYLARYQESMTAGDLQTTIKQALLARTENDNWAPDFKALDKYSARESAKKLVEGMEAVISLKRG